MWEKEINIAAERGEELAQLKLWKENLERERMRIMDNLEKVKMGDISALRANEASRWVGTDIVKHSGSSFDIAKLNLDPSMKEELVARQAKINKLKEDKAWLEKEAFPIIDELDILQKEIEKKDYMQRAAQLTRTVENNSLPPDLRAKQLHHMREYIEWQGKPEDPDEMQLL